MLVEQVNPIYGQSLQHRIDDFSNVFGTAIQAAAALSRLRINVKTIFRGDDYLVANRRQRLTQEFFVRERPVRLRGIEESHAAFEGRTNDLDAVFARYRRAIRGGQPHASVAESRNFETA